MLGAWIGLRAPLGFWFATALLLLVVIAALGLVRPRTADGETSRHAASTPVSTPVSTPATTPASMHAARDRTRRYHAVIVCLGFLGATAATALHMGVAHPHDLVRLATEGASVELAGTVESRVESGRTPWGELSCRATVRVTSLAERAAGHHKAQDKAHRHTPWRGTTIVVHGLPCDALEGQEIEAQGKLAQGKAAQPEAARLHASSARLTGTGTAGARMVRSIDVHLTALLADRPEHVRGLLPGVALGDDSRVSAELEAAMKLTQLTHLIAVSGGHVSILSVLVLLLVGRRWRIVSAGLCLACLAGLVVLVGPQASVLRAAAMSIVVLAALGCGRATQAIASLSLALIAVVLADPWLAMSYGFLLSASATAGIVIVGTPLAEHLSRSMPVPVAQAIAIPLAAQLSCLPVLMIFSDEGSIWGVCANAAVAPVVAPLTVAGLATALLSPILPAIAGYALLPAQMATWWIDAVARTLASWPGSGISLAWAGLVCLLLLILLLVARHPARAFVLILCAVTALLWLAMPRGSAPIGKDWALVQCDVGQGSALVARSQETTIMVDVGPPGGDAAECLERAGVSHLDVLVLSHSHTDHIGGLPQVLQAVTVDEVWLSPNPDPAENTRWVHEQLRAHGVPWSQVQAGESLRQDGSTGPDNSSAPGKEEVARVLWPRRVNTRAGEANAQSIALHINVAGGVLVLSDLTAESQDRMIRDQSVAADVAEVRTVVVAHHGSADQSSRLAERVTAGIALISVGENSYGHPSKRALQLYGDSRAYDTATCGAIALNSQGEVTSRCEDLDTTTAK